MSTSVDPRFVERRAHVREHLARRGLRRAIAGLAAAAALGGLLWLAQSPILSVRTLEISGQQRADVGAVLAATDVYVGRPLIRISEARVEAALMADPWVAEADVEVRYPHRVTVHVVERYEVAAVAGEGGWRILANDGRVMALADGPRRGLGVIAIHPAAAGVGADVQSPSLLAGLEFLEALSPGYRDGAEVRMLRGELWATVAGFQVRLGSNAELAAKAVAAEAMLEGGDPAEGAVIDVIAPTLPAWRMPPPPPPPATEAGEGQGAPPAEGQAQPSAEAGLQAPPAEAGATTPPATEPPQDQPSSTPPPPAPSQPQAPSSPPPAPG